MPCRVATITGCWLSAMRSTVNAQKRCSMYKLPTTEATAANPSANSANTASSSHTKYICSETSVARNIHIHFRLLSLVFIFPLSLLHYPFNTGSDYVFRLLRSLSTDLDAPACPEGPLIPRPVPFDTFRTPKPMVRQTHFGA